jgi:hypothetical protein
VRIHNIGSGPDAALRFLRRMRSRQSGRVVPGTGGGHEIPSFAPAGIADFFSQF